MNLFVIKKNSLCLVAFLALFFVAESAMASMVLSYPGTRARAMGSAFTAVADDSSAVWYNPAGLASGKSEFSFELSDVVKYDYSGFNSGKQTGNGTGYFIGYKHTQSSDNGGFGFGAFIFTPYNFGVTNRWMCSPCPTEGITTVRQQATYYSLAGAGEWSVFKNYTKLGKQKLAFGAVLNFIRQRASVRDSTWTSSYEYESNMEMGLTWGVMYTPVDMPEKQLKVKIGWVMGEGTDQKSPGKFKYDVGSITNVQDEFHAVPNRTELGISVYKGIKQISSMLILSYQTGEEESEDYKGYTLEKKSKGIELMYSKPVGPFKSIALRFGQYTADINIPSPDGTFTSDTWGIGARLGKTFSIEYAKVSKGWDKAAPDSGNAETDIQSISFNFVF